MIFVWNVVLALEIKANLFLIDKNTPFHSIQIAQVRNIEVLACFSKSWDNRHVPALSKII